MTILLPLPTTSRTRSANPALPPSYGFGELPTDIEAGLIRVGEVVRNARRVIVIAGAGISTPAIPDFRSSTGLFKTLRHTSAADVGSSSQRLPSKRSGKGKRSTDGVEKSIDGSSRFSTKMGAAGIRSGKDLFDIKCLSSPILLPHHHALLTTLHRLSTSTRPTPFHILLKTLDDQGRLLRVYTQNIDGLEGKAGLDCRVPELQIKKVVVKGKRKVIGDIIKPEEGRQEPGSQTSSIEQQTDHLERSRSQSLRPEYSIEDIDPGMFERGDLENNFYPLIPSQTTVVSPPGSPDRRPVFEGYSTWPLPSGGQREGYAWDEDVDTTGFDILAEAIASTQPETNTGRTTPVGISHSVTSASDITERRAVEMEITDRGSTGDLEVELGIVREMPTGAEQQQPVSVESTRPSTPTPADYQQTGQAPIRNTLLPRCVPLHGLLHELHCTLCSHSVPLESHLPLPDDIIPCPSCQSHQEERIEKSARPRSIGTLRASVVLYGEEHRHGEAIGAVVEKDIRGNKDDGKVDLLIVAGTTLHIPGVKRMIKEFARVLKSKPLQKKGGQKGKRKPTDGEDAVEVDDEDHDFPVRTIFLNMDPPGKGKGGEWADIFDVWVQGNLQDFVQEWVDKPRRSSRQVEKRQIVLSPFTQIAMPFATFARASSISVRKTGDLTLTLAVKREDKTVALPRKRKAVDEEPIIPQTPPKSSRGRPVKSSAKVLSAKKRQKTQPSTAAPKADSKPPRTPVKTLTIKSSTREPRNSMRRYIREDSPCAYMSDESSSSLSSAPPSSDGEDGEDVSGTPFRHSHVAPDGHYPRSNLAQQSLRRYGQLVQQAALSTSPQGDYRCFLQPHPGSRTSQAALSTPPQGDYRCFTQPHPGSRTSSLTPISSPDYARSPYPATSTRHYGGGEHQGVVIAPPSGVNSRYWEDPSQYTRQRQSREQPQAMLNFPAMKRGSIGSSKMTGGRDMPYL